MAELKLNTSKELLKRLSDSAKKGLSLEEIEQQRVSFIYAGMPKKSGMSKIDIAKSLSKAS